MAYLLGMLAGLRHHAEILFGQLVNLLTVLADGAYLAGLRVGVAGNVLGQLGDAQDGADNAAQGGFRTLALLGRVLRMTDLFVHLCG